MHLLYILRIVAWISGNSCDSETILKQSLVCCCPAERACTYCIVCLHKYAYTVTPLKEIIQTALVSTVILNNTF